MFIALIAIIQLLATTKGDPRTEIIRLTCQQELENNQTQFITNFVRTTFILGVQVRSSYNGTAIAGVGPNTNYGLTQCYGDLSTEDCILCYSKASSVLPYCFPNNGGKIYLDGCFMRLQNYSFFDEYTGPNDTYSCGNRTKDKLYQNTVTQAVSNAVLKAVNDSNEYFAREQMRVYGKGNDSVYVLADCWRTLSPSSCRACLANASRTISKCFPMSEGRVFNTGCFMRYSDTDFFNPIPTTTKSSNRGKIIAIVISVVSSVAVLIVASMIVIYIRRRRYIQKKRKGILSDGREIASKRLFFNNKFRAVDFYNEVNMISSVDHKNLVRLLGCSCSGPESILVYEYLPNMSLNHFIFDKTLGRELTWDKRFEIIIGVAEGLVYLHENSKSRIIHRDIKASNVLLDLRYRAKIADFGLARSFQDDKSHISTAIAGTLGYMAPEYLAHGQLTEKADVYSFGVLLLEVVTGTENNIIKTEDYTESVVSNVWKHFKQGRVEEIFDPNLMMHIYPNIYFQNEAVKVVHVGLLCTQESPSLRPSMSTVLQMLAKDNEPLPSSSNPPFIDEKTMELNDVTIKLVKYHNDDDSSSVATDSQTHFTPR